MDLAGKQAVDFLCYNADDHADRYAAADTMKINDLFLASGDSVKIVGASHCSPSCMTHADGMTPSAAAGTAEHGALGIGVSQLPQCHPAFIGIGWGQYLRDVTVNANVVRGADYGIAVSVAPGAGAAVIADNLISGARLAAIVGMEWKKPVTGDLAKDGAERYAQLSVAGNRVR